jgi:hypothetical protein
MAGGQTPREVAERAGRSPQAPLILGRTYASMAHRRYLLRHHRHDTQRGRARRHHLSSSAGRPAHRMTDCRSSLTCQGSKRKLAGQGRCVILATWCSRPSDTLIPHIRLFPGTPRGHPGHRLPLAPGDRRSGLSPPLLIPGEGDLVLAQVPDHLARTGGAPVHPAGTRIRDTRHRPPLRPAACAFRSPRSASRRCVLVQRSSMRCALNGSGRSVPPSSSTLRGT